MRYKNYLQRLSATMKSVHDERKYLQNKSQMYSNTVTIPLMGSMSSANLVMARRQRDPLTLPEAHSHKKLSSNYLS
jgi:hypothetical protein